MRATVLQAIRTPWPTFAGASWAAWRAFLAALFGLPLDYLPELLGDEEFRRVVLGSVEAIG